jgi:hypothetical protein
MYEYEYGSESESESESEYGYESESEYKRCPRVAVASRRVHKIRDIV